MPRYSPSSATRILTFVSLVVLCALSFAVVYGTNKIVIADTPSQDPLFAFPNANLPHQRRALHHLKFKRASSSISLTSASTSSPAPSTSASSKSSSSNTSPTSSTPTITSSTASSSSSASPSSTRKPSDTTSSTSPTSTSTSSSSPSSTSSSETDRSSSTSVTSSTSSNSPPTSTTPAKSTNGASTTRFSSTSPTSSGILVTRSGSTFTVVAAPTSSASKGKAFFANKAAVGVTFTIVGIIGGLALIMGVVTLIKRHRRYNDDDDDEIYEKYTSAGSATDHFAREAAELGQGGSATELRTDPASHDAHPGRPVHYGQPDSSTVFRPVDYGIDYPPPDVGYANSSAAAPGGRNMAYNNYDHNPNSSQSGPVAGHPFAEAGNSPRTLAVPPASYPRPVPGRAVAMASTDSYYGPNSAGVGSAGMGVAQ